MTELTGKQVRLSALRQALDAGTLRSAERQSHKHNYHPKTPEITTSMPSSA